MSLKNKYYNNIYCLGSLAGIIHYSTRWQYMTWQRRRAAKEAQPRVPKRLTKVLNCAISTRDHVA